MRFVLRGLAAVLSAAWPERAPAHDIPSDATVHVLIRAEGNRLQVLVRAPLRTIRDVAVPERPDGYLDVDRLAPALPGAARQWLGGFLEIHEGPERLPAPDLRAVRISLASDRSFESFDAALRHVRAPPLSNRDNVVWNQLLFDALFEAPIRSARSAFAIRPGLRHLAARTLTVLRFHTPDGAVRAYEFEGDPGLFPLDPSWTQAAARFVRSGIGHILGGADHLLFLVCLVIPYRRFGPLAVVVTAFTLAHSVTLAASALDLAPGALWFPPLIETLIAASIVYMALENIVAPALERRWVFALGFGLIHGFGFSFALRESMQFAGAHLLASLAAFNLGVEIGQVAALLLLAPLFGALFRRLVPERTGIIVSSALVAHTGWHWLVERGELLAKYSFEWPEWNAAFLARLLAWLAVAWLGAGVVWLLRRRSLAAEVGETNQEQRGQDP